MTIKEFYENGFQLIERTKSITTKEWQLDDDYVVKDIVPDAFPTTEKTFYEIIDTHNTKQLPYKFDDPKSAIDFIKSHDLLFQ